MSALVYNFNGSSLSLYDYMARIDAVLTGQSRHVRIREDKIAAYAETIPVIAEDDLFDEQHHFIDSANPESTIAYIFALEACNHGGTFSHLLKKEGLVMPDGLYFTTASRFKAAFEQGRIDAVAMAAMTPARVAQIMEFPKAVISRTLAGMYANRLRSLGQFVTARHGGQFHTFVESAGGSVENFVSAFADIPYFRDIYKYTLDGQTLDIPIFKNAQHIAGSLPLAFARMGRPSPFHDLEKLTCFPDNKISHVLWVDGILEYSNKLDHDVRNGATIAIGSPEEIEIRICGRQAMRLLTEAVNQRHPDVPVTQMQIDHRQWHRSKMKNIFGVPYGDIPCFRTDEPTYDY